MSPTSKPLLLAGVLALCGCTASARHTASPHQLELAKAEPVAPDTLTASEAIAEACCVRELGCNNVGIGKRYVSLDQCTTRVWTDWEDEPLESQCPNGVDDEQLEVCLAELRGLACNVQLDSLEVVPACAASRVCAAPVEEAP